MNIANYLGGDDVSVRTQITLTKKIKALIEEKAALKGQSLSEYLRQAALLNILLDEKGREDLGKLAAKVIGSVDLARHSEWRNRAALNSWLKNLRSEWN